MNTVQKNLRILAAIIQTCIRKITHHDKVGFILEIDGWFNTYRSIDVINQIH